MKLALSRRCVAAGIAILVSSHVSDPLHARGLRVTPESGQDAAQSSFAPTLVSHVMPVYPQIAVSALVTGLLVLEASIDAEGRVAAVRVARSQPLLDQAALDAVRKWRFAPPSGATATVTVRVQFSLEDPAYYPRPATYRQPLPSWIPGNFAFVYKYECRRTTTEIDSIARLVTDKTRVYPPAIRQFPFDFELQQATDVFVALVGAGFFDIIRKENKTTWTEVAPMEHKIRQIGDRVDVTIPAETPIVEVASYNPLRPSAFLHRLKVRRGTQWTEVRWYEPLNRRSSEDEKALAAAGKRLRALANKNLTNSTNRPACL